MTNCFGSTARTVLGDEMKRAPKFLVSVIYLLVAGYLKASPSNRVPPAQPDEFENDPIETNLSDDKESFLVGDMLLPRALYKDGVNKRQPYHDDKYKWPKSGDTVTVPYVKSGIDNDVLQRAIEVFNAKTCIRFVPRGSQKDYVSFQNGGDCSATIGYRGGKQLCSLTSSCAEHKGTVIHEMLHILNFLHEHCRPDRDQYVTIHQDNIQSGIEGNFAVRSGKDLGIPYDCESILHYKATAFSKNGKPTITSSICTKLGNDDTRMSLLDYKRVNTLYGCGNPNYRYFTVKVTTDDSWLSGTDCYIYMKLHGSQKSSSEFELDLNESGGSTNLFEKGTTHTFKYMAYRDDLEPITGISIRMVSHGLGEAWWPNMFVITDPVNNQVVKFGNTKWLEPPSTYGPSTFPKK